MWSCAYGVEPKRPHLLHRGAQRAELYFICSVQQVMPFSGER